MLKGAGDNIQCGKVLYALSGRFKVLLCYKALTRAFFTRRPRPCLHVSCFSLPLHGPPCIETAAHNLQNIAHNKAIIASSYLSLYRKIVDINIHATLIIVLIIQTTP